jgi:hypothetical protein
MIEWQVMRLSLLMPELRLLMLLPLQSQLLQLHRPLMQQALF